MSHYVKTIKVLKIRRKKRGVCAEEDKRGKRSTKEGITGLSKLWIALKAVCCLPLTHGSTGKNRAPLIIVSLINCKPN